MEKGIQVNNIALFGSHLNGNVNTDSDIDPKRLRQILSELENLLAEDNALANRLVRESSAQLRVHLGNRYAGFIRQIEVFDYESALKTLGEISKPEATS